MSHDFDIQRFFQRAPREWLQRYFEERGVLINFDWSTLGKRRIDGLYDAWLELGQETQETLGDDFRNIQLLATEAGKLAILDEAREVDDPAKVAEELEKLEDFYACAFWALLDREALWDGAIFYAAADSKPKAYWRKRINMPALGRPANRTDAEKLKQAVGQLFKDKEARGGICECHNYRRGDREYYFLYPQGHRQTSIEYDHQGQWTKRPYRPAFEIIIVHEDKKRLLSIWHQGSMDRVKDIQVLFAQHVLGTEIERDNPKDNRVYDLSRFLDPDYQLELADEHGIHRAPIRKIRVLKIGPDSHSIRIELGPDCADHVLHRRLQTAVVDIPRSMLRVTSVGITATFEPQGSEKSGRTRSFEMNTPNTCSLDNTPKGIVLQRMLADNGIEPQVQAANEDDAGD